MVRVLKEYNTISDEHCQNDTENNKCWFIGQNFCREFKKYVDMNMIGDCEIRRLRLPECKKKFKEGIVVRVLG